MPFTRKRSLLILREEEMKYLASIGRSRSESHVTVQRARILLAYSQGVSVSRIARDEHTDRPVVERCIDKALSGGIETALKDLVRSGRPPIMNDDDKAWVINLACTKPSEHGFASERWTYAQLARYIREHAEEEGHPSLSRTGKSALFTILTEANIRPHKISCYLEKRDEQFEEQMAQVLFVYTEVRQMNDTGRQDKNTTLSYDEKPGIQAIANTAPDLPPVRGFSPAGKRDHEYKRNGALSLLAGIDLYDGHVLGIVRERHRSKEFIEFLQCADTRYPQDWKIRIILDNHSSHISKETLLWLKTKPNRFAFVYTPKHGSWLNIIEVFFSKMTRAFLRFLRTDSKDELRHRIEQYLNAINTSPVVFRWKYKLDEVRV
jgi:transposase